MQRIVSVVLVVKADTQEEAERDVATRLNTWFVEPPHEAPFPNGALLLWRFKDN